MNGIRFDWDEQKALANERNIILGMSNLHGLLVVSHVYKQNDRIIRIISARKSTKREQQQYREFL